VVNKTRRGRKRSVRTFAHVLDSRRCWPENHGILRCRNVSKL